MSFINKDYRSRQPNRRYRHTRWLVLGAGSVVLSAVLANTSTTSAPTSGALTESLPIPNVLHNAESPDNSDSVDTYANSIESEASVAEISDVDNQSPHDWVDLTVKSGDSLSTLFERAKIKPNQVFELLALKDEVKPLLKIRPDDQISVASDGEGQLQGLRYEIDHTRYLSVWRSDGGLQIEEINHDIETRMTHAVGEIKNSLYLDAQEAGLSDNLIMELAGIFAWDIDFALDIREGDRFAVVYEELFKDGEKIKSGSILSAEFVNRDRVYRAVRYAHPNSDQVSYYSPDGHAMRKAFLRAPVDFRRISSKFQPERYHPVLGKKRPHRGVDYAAATGTPIRAAGDGKVIFRGTKGGYGKTVVLQHGSKYTTLYAHMSKYVGKVRNGSRVKQGQIIGYVGMSGLATGPHLHYEFRVNGVHRNPLTVKLPNAESIDKKYLADFKKETASLVAQLDTISRNALALKSEE